MILGGLDIYKHHTWRWYHWFLTKTSWEKVDFSVIRLICVETSASLSGSPRVRLSAQPLRRALTSSTVKRTILVTTLCATTSNA